MAVAEYKIGPATVRIHGEADKDKIRAASERFAKKAWEAKRRAKKEAKNPNGKN